MPVGAKRLLPQSGNAIFHKGWPCVYGIIISRISSSGEHWIIDSGWRPVQWHHGKMVFTEAGRLFFTGVSLCACGKI